MKSIFRLVVASLFICIGMLHFTNTAVVAQIVPDYLPWPHQLVILSGVFEILGGIGILIKKTRPLAGLGIIGLLLAVLPANIHMAIYNIQPLEIVIPSFVLWARIPFQFVLVFIVWRLFIATK